MKQSICDVGDVVLFTCIVYVHTQYIISDYYYINDKMWNLFCIAINLYENQKVTDAM